MTQVDEFNSDLLAQRLHSSGKQALRHVRPLFLF